MKLFYLRQETGSYLVVGFLCLNIPPFLITVQMCCKKTEEIQSRKINKEKKVELKAL